MTTAAAASAPFTSLNENPALRDFENWHMSPKCEAACAAIRRNDPTTALREAFLAGQQSTREDTRSWVYGAEAR